MNEVDDNGSHRIRLIRPEDNPAVAQIIRQVMNEFGAVGCGFSTAVATAFWQWICR
jgi:hypothetical protein